MLKLPLVEWDVVVLRFPFEEQREPGLGALPVVAYPKA